MRYVTSAERFGIKQGIERGVLRVLRHRFGADAAAEFEAQLQGRPIEELERLLDVTLEAETPAEFDCALRTTLPWTRPE